MTDPRRGTADDPKQERSASPADAPKPIRVPQPKVPREGSPQKSPPVAQERPDVPLNEDERELIEELAAKSADLKARRARARLLREMTGSASPLKAVEKDALFPDLPPELVPQRADGTGALTRQDMAELDRLGTTARLGDAMTRQAADAIQHLQKKMTAIAAEFSEGQINHAQFQAIYTRYCEQRAMIERLRSNRSHPPAWQKSTSSGETAFLRQQFAAAAVGCVLVDNFEGRIIRTFGKFVLESDLLTPILSSLQRANLESVDRRERSTQIDGGRWLSIVPGEYSTTIMVYTREPSAAQRTMLADLHRDFERANHRALKSGTANPARLVYPHRTLYEGE